MEPVALREAEEGEGSGEHAARDPDAEADGAGDEAHPAGDHVEGERDQPPRDPGLLLLRRRRCRRVGWERDEIVLQRRRRRRGVGRGLGRGGVPGDGGDGELEVPVVGGENLGAEVRVGDARDGLEVADLVVDGIGHGGRRRGGGGVG